MWSQVQSLLQAFLTMRALKRSIYFWIFLLRFAKTLKDEVSKLVDPRPSHELSFWNVIVDSVKHLQSWGRRVEGSSEPSFESTEFCFCHFIFWSWSVKILTHRKLTMSHRCLHTQYAAFAFPKTLANKIWNRQNSNRDSSLHLNGTPDLIMNSTFVILK